MLLLDVKTRWSLTHLMLGMCSLAFLWLWSSADIYSPERALLYRDAIDRYTLVHGFHDEALGDDDWKAVKIVAEWLRLFRKATTRMSARDKTTISSVFAVFVSLQNHVRNQLRSLPTDVPAELKGGLVEAHEKLAEYFKKSDALPYYMWAACKSFLLVISAPRVTNSILQSLILASLTTALFKLQAMILTCARTSWTAMMPSYGTIALITPRSLHHPVHPHLSRPAKQPSTQQKVTSSSRCSPAAGRWSLLLSTSSTRSLP
jgi:hypothetical protein